MNKFNSLGCAAALCAAAWMPLAQADAVIDWNARAGSAAVAACYAPVFDPFHESRLYAMAHIAIHDALNAIQRRTTPYAYDAAAPAGASLDAAAAAAARDVMASELAAHPFALAPPAACADVAVALVESEYAAALAAIPDGDAKTDGIATGQAAAAAILALRAEDGADTAFADFGYAQGAGIGEWRFTDDLPFALIPGWQHVAPFALESAGQFPPRAPYPVSCGAARQADTAGSCVQYARDFDEVKHYGGAGDSLRSPDQTQIAIFWIESSPLAWNRIGRDVATARGLDPWENARLFALLNMALADGYIAVIESKYRIGYWRPETAIRLADGDGNPWTQADPDWVALGAPVPPFPDHESGHSVEGGAAAEVFRRLFGTDNVAFDACSVMLPGDLACGGAHEVRRQYSSFSQAAQENADSRVLVGYHFRNAVEEGVKRGRKIGAHAVKNYLRPAH